MREQAWSSERPSLGIGLPSVMARLFSNSPSSSFQGSE